MFRKSLSVIFVMLFVFMGFYCAEAGMLDGLKGKTASSGGPSVSRSDLDSLYKSVTDADGLLKKSVDTAFKMLATKDEIDKMEQRQKECDIIKDPKEKEAAINKVQEDKMATTQKAADNDETSKKCAAMDAQNKALFGKSIYNLVLAGLKDKDAVVTAKDITQKIKGNPTAATSFAADASKLKDIVTTVPPQAEKTATLGSHLSKFASKNKIEVALPQSSSEKPKEVEMKD